jgi:hypothetical protein
MHIGHEPVEKGRLGARVENGKDKLNGNRGRDAMKELSIPLGVGLTFPHDGAEFGDIFP